MKRKEKSSTKIRLIAALLAVIWITGGSLAIVFGLLRGQWWPPVLGAIALYYGLIWARAAYEGRLLTVNEFLLPWRKL